MMPQTSVAMTATTEETLVRRLVRDDGQEDICLATYRPSTGLSRLSALVRVVVPASVWGPARPRECNRYSQLHPEGGGSSPGRSMRPGSTTQPPWSQSMAAHEWAGPRLRGQLRQLRP